MKVFRLKKGLERRFLSGHPWVYSNEIQGSPKEIQPGDPVEIQSPQGEFIALGYGNPHSLIFFRALSRNPADRESTLEQILADRLRAGLAFRRGLGIGGASFRWSHGEGDHLPGLIVDLYCLETASQKSGASPAVAVIQMHTFGMDRMREAILRAVQEIGGKDLAIVLRNDVSVRKLEGLEMAEPEVLANPLRLDLERACIRVRGSGAGETLFDVNLVHGQKTGFFMDQNENISQIESLLRAKTLPKRVRILDLCCYVGQWSTRLSAALKKRGHEAECTLVDASADALEFAAVNVKRAGGVPVAKKGDILRDLESIAEPFDIVISDPPALIQGRKNIPQGTHAYLQLHTQALRLTKPEGVLVACSCSQLLDEEEMLHTLQKAGRRNGKGLRFFARGTQAWDHPIRIEFPEGRYLKMWAGVVEADTGPKAKEEVRS